MGVLLFNIIKQQNTHHENLLNLFNPGSDNLKNQCNQRNHFNPVPEKFR